MMSKNLYNKNFKVDYLTFQKHFSSELKFMSPWIQINNAEQKKLPKGNKKFTKERESQNNF